MSNNLTSKKVWSVEERQEMMEYITGISKVFQGQKFADICQNDGKKLAITLEEAVELQEFDKNPQDLDTKTKGDKRGQKNDCSSQKGIESQKIRTKGKSRQRGKQML